MEQYLFADNRPSHPLDFFYRLHFVGQLDTDQVITAFHNTLPLHPLLRSTIQSKGRKHSWQLCQNLPHVKVQENNETKLSSHPPIDISQESGCRLSIATFEQTTTLQFQFHHSATDGLGALGFIGDMLSILAQSLSVAATQPERDAEKLKGRHSCGYPDASLWQKISKQIQAIYLSRKFIGCRVCSVTTHQPDVNTARSNEDAFTDIQHRLTVEETCQLQRTAKKKDVSVNTLMLRDAFVAIEKFRSSRDDGQRDGFIRIAVPGNMRADNTNYRLPAANFFSMTFPAANSVQTKAPDQLLQRLHEEIGRARKDYYFATFLLMLKIARAIPGGLKQILKPNKCQASLLLTNVGKIFPNGLSFDNCDLQDANAKNTEIEFAGTRLNAVDFVAPMRPYQSISFAMHQYAGRQSVNLSYDPRVHDDAEAKSILYHYVEQLRHTTRDLSR